MLPTDQHIRRTDIPEYKVRSFFLSHPGCQELKNAGIARMGMDEHPKLQEWGEGFSSTELLFMVIEGEVSLPTCNLTATPGNMLLVPPTVPKRLATTDKTLTALWVHLYPESFLKIETNSAQVLPTKGLTILKNITEALIEESLSPSTDSIARCRHWSSLILLYLTDLVRTPGTDFRMRRILGMVWQKIDARIGEEWTTESMAACAHISAGHFHRQTQEFYGKSPQQMLRQLRLERAMALLRTTDWTLDAIAANVGYATGFALSNAFQRCLGRRPASFRNTTPA